MFTRARQPESHERPVLRLGLAGYTAAEEAALAQALQSEDEACWQLARLGDADAWCVNGARVQVLPDRTLRIAPGLASKRSIRIDPAQVDWPLAFSKPPAGVKQPLAFDARVPGSIRAVLKQFEDRLRTMAMQFSLASTVVEHNLDLRSGVFHISVNGRMVALVSQRRGVGVSPMASPADLHDAVWSHRPESADAMPGHFACVDFSQFMWQYATRTRRDCLPPHYRTSRLYLRRPPRLALQLLKDETLLLVRELGFAAGDFAELRQRTGLAEPELARQLAALYMVGAITADPRRAPPPRVVQSSGEWNSVFAATTGANAVDADMTVRLSVKRGAGVRYVAQA